MNSPARLRPLALRPRDRCLSRRGLSLMELLVATTISIMVMGATVTLFGVVGDRINGGRAMIETSDRLRAVQNLLRRDLLGHTPSMLPWEQPSAGAGYFEIIKGPLHTGLTGAYPASNRDSQPFAANVTLGYTQDVLMLTTRSPDQPFSGRAIINNNLTTVESPIAEVVWFMQPTFNAQGQLSTPLTYTLYRRQFLIFSPGNSLPTGKSPQNIAAYYDTYDVSAHPDGNGKMVANSLADLTYRENRFGHNFPGYNAQPPYSARVGTITAQSSLAANTYDAMTVMPFPVDGPRVGEDVVLTNVLSFDIKVWDPGAEVLQDRTSPSIPPLVPSDPGYTSKSATAMSPRQYGAYVDLNYANIGTPLAWNKAAPPDFFAGPFYGLGKNSQMPGGPNAPSTYDSWSTGYEYYARGAPPGTYNHSNNGFDNNGGNGVNDAAERLTSPPYPVPLRGVQIKIRVYEPSTRQVREITVTESFMPD
jgi:hypothetical protein